jgi:hypothetical protein
LEGNSRETLQVIERDAFAGQDGAGRAADAGQQIAAADPVALSDCELDTNRRIQQRINPAKNRQAADAAVFFGDQPAADLCCRRDDRIGGNVAGTDILGQGAADQRVDDQRAQLPPD